VSSEKQWLWIAVAVGGYLLLRRGGPIRAVQDVTDIIGDIVGRGRRLSHSTLDDNGVVQEDVDDLLVQAVNVVGSDFGRDAYALARMVRSEDGSADLATKVRLANVAINQARDLGMTPEGVILYHKTDFRSGKFGRQISGRFASTLDPYEIDLKAALQALQGDTTQGATNFAHQSAFGVQVGTASSIQPFVDALAKEGKVPGYFADRGPDLVFFWRGSVPNIATEGLG